MTDSPEILEIHNPAAFDLPEIRELFEQACERGNWANADDLIFEAKRFLHRPEISVLIGRHNGPWSALAYLMAPTTRLVAKKAQVWHFYNTGGNELRKALISACVEKAKSWGCDGFRVANTSGKPDRAWKKVFSQAGKTTRIGGLFDIDFDAAGE